MPSSKQEIDESARSTSRREPTPGFELSISKDDIGYTHPIFVQCFLPVRHNASNAERWQVNNRQASLLVRAGEIVDSSQPGTFRRCAVPAGSKAYLVANYINDYALKKKTRTIPLGESLREGMKRIQIPIGGRNGHELQRELENFITSTIHLGTWGPHGKARQQIVSVADQVSFWEEDAAERRVWRSEVTLSQAYFEMLRNRPMAPIFWPALLALQHNPRAMGIHSWLVYTLRHHWKGGKLSFSRHQLHQLFGQGIQKEKFFWPEFKSALLEAHRWYPTARIEFLPDGSGITLRNSPSLIPFKKS